MKLLYGVQGTGNGHITRAIAVSEALHEASTDAVIDVLISGRPPESLPISARNFHWRDGLSFVTSAGQIDLWKTVTSNNVPKNAAGHP